MAAKFEILFLSRLTLPSPVLRVGSSTASGLPSPRPAPHPPSQQTKTNGQPGVPPRNPKVSVPFYSPNVSSAAVVTSHQASKSLFNGAKPRFFATSSPKHPQNSTDAKLNLSAISRLSNGHNSIQQAPTFIQTHKSISNTSRGQTPDWIRDIFLQAKRGNREKLVRIYFYPRFLNIQRALTCSRGRCLHSHDF